MVSCLAYSSALKIEETYCSETSVAFQLATWRFVQEDRTFQVSEFVTQNRLRVFCFADLVRTVRNIPRTFCGIFDSWVAFRK
jgi:hypothetical protein